MKVLLLTDYFYPFNPGGTEWSVYELAKSFKKNNIDVKIVTLNYGTNSREKFNNIDVIRLPFFKKLSSKRQTVNPIWQNNPIFFFSSALHLFKLQKSEKAQIIHVHGKFLIPAASIVGVLTRTSVIVSIRDKQLLCSIGRCFFRGNENACNAYDYLFKDFPWFYRNYISNKNIFTFIYSLLGAIWSRIAYSIIKLFLKKAAQIIAISNSQKKYLAKNGIKDAIVIYNSATFAKVPSKIQKSKKILFAGKLSKGKGADLLLKAFKLVSRKLELTLLVVGSVDQNFKKSVKTKSISVLGELDHRALIQKYEEVSATIVPSIYPEAFGRVALESISQGVPVVGLNTGALPEIIKDGVTGRIVEPNSAQLAKATIEVVENEIKYKENIKKEIKKLKRTFSVKPIKQHLLLYNQLSK